MRLKIKQWKCVWKETLLDILMYTINMVLLTLGYRIIAYAWGLRGSEWTGKTNERGIAGSDLGAFQWEQIKNIVVLLTAIGVLITIGVSCLMFFFEMNQQYKRNRINALESAMGYGVFRICRANIIEEELKAIISFLLSIGISWFMWSLFDNIEYISMLNEYWKSGSNSVISVYLVVGVLFFTMIMIYTYLITEFSLTDDEANLLREE